jgi:hypothetical protein
MTKGEIVLTLLLIMPVFILINGLALGIAIRIINKLLRNTRY